MIPQFMKLPSAVIGVVAMVASAVGGIAPEAPQPEINWNEFFSGLNTHLLRIEIEEKVIAEIVDSNVFQAWYKDITTQFLSWLDIDVSGHELEKLTDKIIKRELLRKYPNVDYEQIDKKVGTAFYNAKLNFLYGEKGLNLNKDDMIQRAIQRKKP